MKKSIFSVLLVAGVLFFTSCKDKIMGYSIVLWNLPEQQISAGEVIPVYIKSNISHVYVAGLSDEEKFEVPLWKMTEPLKKKKAMQEAEKYREYAHTYASAKIDGLPIRNATVNTSKQVYRLRKGEVLKVLYKGSGQAVMAGQNALEGDWLRVLTDDGTLGWCFSYNLALFETDMTGERIGGEEIVVEEKTDRMIETVLASVWYPDYFKTLIENGNIDLARLNPAYRFSIDTVNNKVSLNLADIHQSWTYEGYTKTGDKEYTLKNIPVVIYYKNSAFIVARYTGESGKPQDLNFVTLSENLSDLIANEKVRRSRAYDKVVLHGPKFKSSNYGTLTLKGDGTFTWTAFKLLVPSVIDAKAKNGGTASVKYAISKSLQSNYDGVITFNFEGSSNEVNFLYKMENGGLRLESVSASSLDGNLVKSRGNNSTIAYFSME